MATTSGGRMPLLEHLREFRRRIVRSSIAILVASGFGWYFYNPIITALARPVCDLSKAQASNATHCGSLYINGVLGPLNLQIKVALLTGVIVSAPIWLYQLWAFIAPGLHRKEKRNSALFLLSATPFFDDYLDFVMRVILLFGLAFELPIFLVALNLIGFLSGRAILRPWRIWVFGIALFTAAFTPTGDPLTMSLLAVPLCLLYFLAGGIALLVDRQRAKRSVEGSI
jgi:sec-independent protein translocase protein TatC